MIPKFNIWKNAQYMEYRYPEDKIRFLCEQDGPPERELKREFVKLFRDDSKILRAYLARIAFDSNKDYLVALCIFLDTATPLNHKQLESRTKRISQICWKMLPKGIHLEIIFLNGKTEAKVLEVCSPFYVGGAGD